MGSEPSKCSAVYNTPATTQMVAREGTISYVVGVSGVKHGTKCSEFNFQYASAPAHRDKMNVYKLKNEKSVAQDYDAGYVTDTVFNQKSEKSNEPPILISSTPITIDESTEFIDKWLVHGAPSSDGSTCVDVKYGDPNYYFKDRNYKVKSDVKAKTIQYKYEGEFGKELTAGPKPEERMVDHGNGPEVIKKRNELICLYHTTDDMYYFNDSVFEDWMMLIQQEHALQLILDDIRAAVDANPGLIMLNKVNNQLGPLARKLNKTTTYVDLPFGPPLVTIPTSHVLPKKFYHSDYRVNNTIDTGNVTYDINKKSNSIVNAVGVGDTFKGTNYLDETYESLLKACKIGSDVNEQTAVCVMIPKRGFQLFEVVSDSTDAVSNQRIKQADKLVEVTTITKARTEDVAFDGNAKEMAELESNKELSTSLAEAGSVILPRVIVSFSDVGSIIGEAYDDMKVSIPVPMVKVKVGDGTINFDINTLSDSADNRVKVYVAKAGRALGSYTAGLQTKKDINGVDVSFISVAYDGQESKRTPVMLQNRFQ